MQKECNKNNCLWVKDHNNGNHYMCLKCGRERWLNKRKWGLYGLLIVLKAVVSTLFLD
ncbi:MAG: hypothetical protein F6K25_28965 [Okeania sp. SIO2G4]|uniref:hypothetical protein n=1 Tax=unclassified Okeania TaxID=2634635 RepID=UPI0013B837CD|nr:MULTISPECIES: hypothetical protein [unclassified Okeania]NEP06417.1 hypothetical protein [Okeania sp. SIO4D6]NEP39255.1 hypothetical protein [Okeania sp. SIO2H7]NEP75635.1 hypothetical protein [Okeania sp. SIO2G5]NEP96763.1 hypothetical protein [Okeania sp. SIO2F5]NEQ94464.1 hypothetical protein [Okeania sp. SIO2G4]